MEAQHPELEPVFDAIRDGRLDVALTIAQELARTAQGPLQTEARRHLGLCFFHLGDYASSVPSFLQVAQATGERQAWFVLALARTLAGDPVGGERDFDRALAAPEPPGGEGGRQLTEHFMRFDYMHVLVDAWQWERARAQLDLLAGVIRGLPSHDNEFLFDRGYPLLGDLLDGGLRVLEIVPDSDPFTWLKDLRRDLTGPGRLKVDQTLQALSRKIGGSA